MVRKRIIGNQYELARINVPAHVAQYIMSKRRQLKNCECWDVYKQLKEEYRSSPSYTESQRLTYLYELFWVLSGQTPITIKHTGKTECVPTDYLEREVDNFGFDKVQPCESLSLRVSLDAYQKEQVFQMIDIVEKKMHSFATDFYVHDMLCFSRELGKNPILWIVGKSHTFKESLDAERDAQSWAECENLHRRDCMVYGSEDDTWVGAALRVSCGKEDDYYYHDGGMLHKVSREKFTSIHTKYVERVRQLAKEKIENKKAA